MSFREAVVDLETGLGNALAAMTDSGDPDRIERILKLLIKKEIVLKMILIDMNRL